MQIRQNRPIDKFMRFHFMCSSALCIVTYGVIKIYAVYTNICDLHLTRIHVICIINLTQKFVALRYHTYFERDYIFLCTSSIMYLTVHRF